MYKLFWNYVLFQNRSLDLFRKDVFLRSCTKLSEKSLMAESFSKSLLTYNLHIFVTGISIEIYATFQNSSSGEHI